MNKLKAIVKHQKHINGLTRIEAMCGEYLFRLLIFEDAQINRDGKDVYLIIKESEIAVSKSKLNDISISNRVECTVENVNIGEMLCEITMSFAGETIRSIITAESVQRLNIAPQEKLYALIKANEIYLESIDD
jgi:molybdopterin-binding protein